MADRLFAAFEVPDLGFPFEPHIHPRADDANRVATDWAVAHVLIRPEATRSFAGIAFGHLAARVLHSASFDHVVTLAKWMAWSFVLDDQHDHLIRTRELDVWAPLAGAIRSHLAEERPGRPLENPMFHAFVELADQILAGMAPMTAARFTTHISDMLDSLDQEAANRTGARSPTIADYILTRRHSSQLPAMMDMSEAALGIGVPARVYDSATFQELLWSTIDVISWENDLFSLRKEASCGDNNNIAFLLTEQQHQPLQDVVEDVGARIAARVEDFLLASEHLSTMADPPAQTCAVNFEDWIIGADRWQREDCTRYRDERWIEGLEGAYTRPDLLAPAHGAGDSE